MGKLPPPAFRAPECTTEIATLTFKYIRGPQVTRRTDQRGVTLALHHGTRAGQTTRGPTLPVNQVTGVEVSCPSPSPTNQRLPDTGGKFAHHGMVGLPREVVYR